MPVSTFWSWCGGDGLLHRNQPQNNKSNENTMTDYCFKTLAKTFQTLAKTIKRLHIPKSRWCRWNEFLHCLLRWWFWFQSATYSPLPDLELAFPAFVDTRSAAWALIVTQSQINHETWECIGPRTYWNDQVAYILAKWSKKFEKYIDHNFLSRMNLQVLHF